jgi:hypothetical protein
MLPGWTIEEFAAQLDAGNRIPPTVEEVAAAWMEFCQSESQPCRGAAQAAAEARISREEIIAGRIDAWIMEHIGAPLATPWIWWRTKRRRR